MLKWGNIILELRPEKCKKTIVKHNLIIFLPKYVFPSLLVVGVLLVFLLFIYLFVVSSPSKLLETMNNAFFSTSTNNSVQITYIWGNNRGLGHPDTMLKPQRNPPSTWSFPWQVKAFYSIRHYFPPCWDPNGILRKTRKHSTEPYSTPPLIRFVLFCRQCLV